MRRPVVAGNWKMNGRRDRIAALTTELIESCKEDRVGVHGVDIIVCPPAIYIPQVVKLVEGEEGSAFIAVGAQNVSEYNDGAYTGEISSGMLTESGCHYVIVGHSERRNLFAETDDQVAQKVQAALNAGMTPILCLGESKSEREAGETLSVVSRQLSSVVKLVGIEGISNIIIAYEPVWAIGTGLSASPEQAQEVHKAIREKIGESDEAVADRVRILYGGSVNATNAKELFKQADIDGGLIGGASLKAADFISICRAAVE